jgi:hypothetical protein
MEVSKQMGEGVIQVTAGNYLLSPQVTPEMNFIYIYEIFIFLLFVITTIL